ncbi:nucleotidyltransferase family protein [uncultured Paraglaciecola sp.]|uniref:nucleotidyltransferase family protein n=1 Tax=uncultured Paraglaciecola sp. TaxID=1765024 RepID=UPI0030DB8F03
MKTELLLLAAGQSKRFGGIKQLTKIQGKPMVCHCLIQYRLGDSWLEGLADGHIALGANAALIKDLLPINVNKHVIETWENGMGHTLAESMQYLAPNTTHVLIGLADQVMINQQMIKGILAQSSQFPKNIVASKYAGRLGAPVIFPRQYFSQLRQLKGDQGARHILRQHVTEVVSMQMPEAALDIDSQDDLKAFNLR